MSIQELYLHTLVVKRNEATGDVDEYNQPETAPVTVATVPGLIQPRSAREVAASSNGGADIGQHVAYLDLLEGIDTDAWIEKDGIRFDIVSIADAGGVGHHLELGLVRVS